MYYAKINPNYLDVLKVFFVEEDGLIAILEINKVVTQLEKSLFINFQNAFSSYSSFPIIQFFVTRKLGLRF